MSSIALIIKLVIHEGHEEEFAAALRDVLKQVRQEPACLSIAGHQDPDDPTTFLLVEIWESREAFAEFEANRAYLRDYMQRVKPLWAKPREMSVWQTVA